MTSLMWFFIASALLSSTGLAAPQIIIPYPGIVYNVFCPIVDNMTEVSGKRWQIGLSVGGGVSKRAGLTPARSTGANMATAISVSQTYSIGTSWTKGSTFGIKVTDLITMGGTWTVSETVTYSFAQGVSGNCGEPGAPPGPKRWRCSVLIIPSVLRVTGHLERMSPGKKCPVERIPGRNGDAKGGKARAKDGDVFEFEVPILDKGRNPKWTYVVCTCKNLQHWADEGHPATLCPEPCTRPEG